MTVIIRLANIGQLTINSPNSQYYLYVAWFTGLTQLAEGSSG